MEAPPQDLNLQWWATISSAGIKQLQALRYGLTINALNASCTGYRSGVCMLNPRFSHPTDLNCQHSHRMQTQHNSTTVLTVPRKKLELVASVFFELSCKQ